MTEPISLSNTVSQITKFILQYSSQWQTEYFTNTNVVKLFPSSNKCDSNYIMRNNKLQKFQNHIYLTIQNIASSEKLEYT